MDVGRLKRGRSYAGPHRLIDFNIDNHIVKATVRGNINPYFGVYKEPRYKVSVNLRRFSQKDWELMINQISKNAAFISQLMMDEMPSRIEDVFTPLGHNLLPRERSDLVGKCSCPDYASPCKHVAGVYYKIASLLDRDPLLLFQLRGIKFETLHKKLSATQLGQILVNQQSGVDIEIEYHAHRYTNPRKELHQKPELKSFWLGEGSVPQFMGTMDIVTPAILIKLGSDYPIFWNSDKAFPDIMETVYSRVVKANKANL